MNYENIINMDNVTLDDCLSNYIMKNMAVEINDGHIVDFVKEEVSYK